MRKRERHNMHDSREYRAWVGMKARCLNINAPKYPSYGGRGIKVCPRWVSSFNNFYEDMGDRTSPDHSLDRINNDGDYTPENCRWATRPQQMRNRKIMGKHGINGVKKPDNSWVAVITNNYKSIYLGSFDNFFEACCARKSAENRYWKCA